MLLVVVVGSRGVKDIFDIPSLFNLLQEEFEVEKKSLLIRQRHGDNSGHLLKGVLYILKWGSAQTF